MISTENVIAVEIAIALTTIQELVEIKVDKGTTVRDALEQSGIYERFVKDELRKLAVGIWGQLVDPDRVVKNGDRIELYRQLEIDPRDARRRLAESGRTMGRSSKY